MRVMVMGPTGAVGGEIVRQCLGEPRVASVLAVARRPIGMVHDKLTELLHDDFSDFSVIEPTLARVDACLCALGISWVDAPDERRYRRVTVEYGVAAARSLARANPAARFSFVSAREIDRASVRPHVRIKAEAEAALRDVLGARLTVFRPGYIHPVHPRPEPAWQDRLFGPFLFLRPLLPRHVTDTVEVARAMLQETLAPERLVYDNGAIREAAASYVRSRTVAGASP